MALPKISSVQTVAPRGSIPITVSKTSPVNEVIAASAGNLSKRLDSFAASANKIAIGQGKMTGERQGAIDAAELLEQARQTGEPISLSDLPGDFSSISVVEQAARKGALKVISSNFAVEGRKAITDAALAASANPDITPQAFGQVLDNIVSNHTEALTALSPTEGAKLGASLSIVANSTGVSQARSFATAQKNLRKTNAIANVSTFQDNLKDIIDGFVPDPDGNVTLKRVIDSELHQMESYLINEGVPGATVKQKIEATKKVLQQHRIAVVKDYARKQVGDPIGGMFATIGKLQNGDKLDNPHMNSLAKSLDPVARDKLISELRSEHSGLISTLLADENHKELGRNQTLFNKTNDFYQALKTDRAKARAIVEDVKLFNPKAGKELEEIFNQGSTPDTPNNLAVKQLLARMGDGREKVGDLMSEINNGNFSINERAELFKALKTFQDSKVKAALTIARSDIGIDPDLVRAMADAAPSEQRRLLSIYDKFKGKLAREALNPAFDPVAFVDTQLAVIQRSETEQMIKDGRKSVIRRLGYLLPDAEKFDATTIPGLRLIQKQLTQLQKDRSKRRGAQRISNQISDLMEAMNDLAGQ